MIIIMLGAPATGKGTVAGILSKELNIPAVSTGDLFRDNMKNGTEVGKLAESYISKGNLVPDEVTVRMVEERLSKEDAKNGVILDGFPRTIGQAEKLDELLKNDGKEVNYVINLTTPEDELLERTTTRRVCRNCGQIYNIKTRPTKVEGICDICGGEVYQRNDAKLDVAKNRLEVYKKETAPLEDFYKKTGKMLTFELSERINKMAKEVSEDVIKYIDQH